MILTEAVILLITDRDKLLAILLSDINNWGKDTYKYLRALEEIIIRTCADYGLVVTRVPKYTGVWIEDRKIAAIGIKVTRWITMHGFALNVNTDLSLFNGIIPCGITNKKVTSLKKSLKEKLIYRKLNPKYSIMFWKFSVTRR